MKALDPMKLLGITFNQSSAQDRGAKSERAHAQCINGLGLRLMPREKELLRAPGVQFPTDNYRHGRKREDHTCGRS